MHPHESEPAPAAPPEIGPSPISPAVRWVLIVFLPAIGFTLGAFIAFSLIDLQFTGGRD